MRKFLIGLALSFSSISAIIGQGLSYYLPDITYNDEITTPAEFFGHEVGEFHATHDKIYYYFKQLASESERMTMTEYARSHEKRPLIYLTVTSQSNHANLDDIKAEHKKLTHTTLSRQVDISDMPAIIYQGASIHGNEASGANAAILVAYYLAAGQGSKIETLLNDVVILLDPCYNPDGLQRFSTWVNSHKGKQLITDPNSREYTETWPRGRTNHYWFDLNRDWLLLTHPESQGRIRTFHEWKPDILTDHHEMGTNSTFFFQPGIPSRTNPNTPQLNQDLTYKVAIYHGRALDSIGSLYYTKESFDDYYYGKGSTYPDAQGCIGILFEQASSRGHLQESSNGLLSFPFTIRNQLVTFLSTQDAAVALREQILNYKRESFLEGRELAKKNPVKGYVFGDRHDQVKVNRLIELLLSHQIEVYHYGQEVTIGAEKILKETAYAVPLDQDQYRLAKSIFETVDTFKDSLFYDVSAWTIPLALDVPYKEIRSNIKLGERLVDVPLLDRNVIDYGDKTYAYLINWDDYYAPRALTTLLEKGALVKLSNEPFEIWRKDAATVTFDGGTASSLSTLFQFDRGTLIIPTGNNQPMPRSELDMLLKQISAHNQLNIVGVNTGLVESGVNLGSRSNGHLKDPKMMVLVGQGVNSYDAGEIWHYMDHYLEKAVPMIDVRSFSKVDLDEYDTIIMPDGNYSALTNQKDKLNKWVKAGGNMIAIKRAINWLNAQDIISIEYQKPPKSNSKKRLPYQQANEDSGSKVTGGMIAQVETDITHPLFYGYHRDRMAVFHRGNDYVKPLANPYHTPAVYTSDPVLSGYLHTDNEQMMRGSASVFSQDVGRGKVIGLIDNPVFRGYFWGTHKLLANAIFFGHSY